MNTLESNIFISSIFQNYKIPSDDFTYIYRGMLSEAISDSILELTERNFEKHKLDELTFKKVYFILVEILQNVTKYQEEDEKLKSNSIVIVQRLDSKYYLTVGNLINNSEIYKLRERIDKINLLNKEELNQYYKTILINGKYNKKGGAGLGLINIKRRSKHKLNYSFSRVNEEYSYFYFNSIVAKEGREKIDFSFKNIKNTHKIFKKDKISLLFSNIFNQDKLKGLLNIVEEKIHERLQTKKRIFNILVEVLQNIIYHTAKDSQFAKDKFGIFFISETNKYYKLKAGNFINNSEIKQFMKELERVNHFSEEQLEEAYLEELRTSNHNENNNNLGILDIRLRSSNFLKYEFQKINDEFSFFTIEINIDK